MWLEKSEKISGLWSESVERHNIVFIKFKFIKEIQSYVSQCFYAWAWPQFYPDFNYGKMSKNVLSATYSEYCTWILYNPIKSFKLIREIVQ